MEWLIRKIAFRIIKKKSLVQMLLLLLDNIVLKWEVMKVLLMLLENTPVLMG